MDILYSPQWFYGKDIIIDLVSIVVLLLIGYFNRQYYFIDRHKKEHNIFAFSFLLLGISFIFKILTNFTLYTHVIKTEQWGIFDLTYHVIQYSNLLLLVGTIASHLLTLFGMYLLYSTYYKKQLKSSIFFIAYFLIIITYFSDSAYYLFHLTTFFFLVFIIAKLYQNCRLQCQNTIAKLTTASFIIIAVSQVLFTLIGINQIYYVIAELVQLVGYALLLISFILVLRNGQKKI